MNIVVIDIGGTNARFGLADVQGGKVTHLSEPVIFPAADHEGLTSAWQAFAESHGTPLPRHAAIGVAGPVTGGPIRFVNSHWVIDPATLKVDLGLDRVTLLNDFGAMAHAVHALNEDGFVHLSGPDVPLPRRGAISVIGPGTGLGVAVLQRRESGPVILETEGSHVHFAPLDAAEQRVSDAVAARFGRTSIERVVSGPGLGEIVRTTNPEDQRSDAELWASAEKGDEPRTREALSLWLGAYGSAVGDLSLAHGAMGIALTGGLTNRIADQLRSSQFHARLCAKGRYRTRMDSIPVKLVTHPQPGLFGAAAAFALEHVQ